MKRRPTVRCAAANDDEDLGSIFDHDRREKKPKSVASEKAEAADHAPKGTGSVEKQESRKKKEFAWMDSDEEDADDAADEVDEAEETVNAEVLANVQSFGRMLILVSALRKWLRSGSMSAPDVGAVCQALERTKLYDGDVLEDLYVVLRQFLEGDKLSVEQANSAVTCLHALNACDKAVLSAVAVSFQGKTASMDASMRNAWVEVFKKSADASTKKFVQLLQAPPLDPSHPSYRRLKCAHFAQGHCALEGACSWSHDESAPVSLTQEPIIRKATSATGKEAVIDWKYSQSNAQRAARGAVTASRHRH